VRSHGTPSSRSFGLTFAGVFIALGILGFTFKGGGYGWFAAGFVLVLVSILMPRVLAPLKRWWLKLGHLLGAVINPVALGLVYLFAITLMGGVLRLFKRDLLSLRRDPACASYWIPREPGPAPQSMKEPF
jgi:hypothetical protein